ncbi:uncharacterized protein EI90DRAFT_3011659 [Cantharellus anzutake]|uniref:uncharacterized protein n=1 Tax=Cantharellus anzutake TaxID=1750568 RepID=UPI0019045409|nr:uncharacterized protein EI90DRAFT_3011659 [Cantharellus anzutake]KAF8342116.1 hypothetical protein EI90DRAFT_3011659 [Cantharellus anzutake]
MVYEFKQEVKKLKLGLSGSVENPCWEGLGIEPFVFIKQDILHGIHKFIWDHPGKWMENLVKLNLTSDLLHNHHFTIAALLGESQKSPRLLDKNIAHTKSPSCL